MSICSECGKDRKYLFRKDLAPPDGMCKSCHQNGRRAAEKECKNTPKKIIVKKDIPAYQPLSYSIHIRMTKFERGKLRLLAEKYGMSSNAIIRALIRGSS